MLQPATKADFNYFYELYMHPSINPFLLYELMDADEFLPIFEDLLAQKVLYIFLDDATKVAVGMCKLVPQKHRNTHCIYIGGIAVCPNQMGKGYAKQLFLEIIDHCKKRDFKRLELSVATTNTKAIQLYKSVGFEKEGTLRNFTFLKSKNTFIDEDLMSLLL